MSVIYRTTLKNARLQAVIDDIGAGGILKIGSAAMAVVLAQVTLGATAFDTPSGGSMTLTGAPRSDTSADATGTAAAATVCKSDGTVVISGLTVGTIGSGANIELNSVDLDAGEEVRIDSGIVTHG